MKPIEQDLDIYRGASFSASLQWCSSEPTYLPITGVVNGLPTQVTVENHGLTGRTLVWIANVLGPRDLNTGPEKEKPPRVAYPIDANTLAIEFNTGNATPWQSGGVLIYYAPVDLTGYAARMQIRRSVQDSNVLLELSTDTGNGGIVITPASGTIERRISATDTAALQFDGGVYDLLLTDSTGFVTRLAQGSVRVLPDVTR